MYIKKAQKVANKIIAAAEEVEEIQCEDKVQEGSETTVHVLCKMLGREMSKTIQLEEQLDKTQKKLLDLNEKIEYAEQKQSEVHDIGNLHQLLSQEKERSKTFVNQLKEIRSNETQFQDKIQELENELQLLNAKLDATQSGEKTFKIKQNY